MTNGARAPLRTSGLRCRVRRDLNLYSKTLSPRFDESRRGYVQRSIETRLPVRMARLHAREGRDTAEAAKWTQLQERARLQRVSTPPAPESDPPAPPPSTRNRVPSPGRAPASAVASSPSRISGRLCKRAVAVREIQEEVRGALDMIQDLAFHSASNRQRDQAIQVMSQDVSDARDSMRASALQLESAHASRASSRMRTLKIFTAATGVAAAIVFGGGLGSAAYVAGAVGFGAVAALA